MRCDRPFAGISPALAGSLLFAEIMSRLLAAYVGVHRREIDKRRRMARFWHSTRPFDRKGKMSNGKPLDSGVASDTPFDRVRCFEELCREGCCMGPKPSDQGMCDLQSVVRTCKIVHPVVQDPVCFPWPVPRTSSPRSM